MAADSATEDKANEIRQAALDFTGPLGKMTVSELRHIQAVKLHVGIRPQAETFQYNIISQFS